jgi:hypothetical protein
VSAISDRMNELAQRSSNAYGGTPTDAQNASDLAHANRLLNDEYARLAVAGTVASVAHNVPISSGSTIVSLSTGVGLLASTRNWFSGTP